MTHRAFVAFSGGGAKGIVHVGALKALEVRGVEFVGLSGTSAGSIIACLAASGFKADELINPTSHETILNSLSQIDPRIARATDLFGHKGWLRIKFFRWLIRLPVSVLHLVTIIWALPGIVGFLASFYIQDWVWYSFLIAWCISSAALFWTYKLAYAGLADVSAFRDALAQLLQQKMFPNEEGRIVKMADFGTNGHPSLKIVAANLTRRALHLFSSHRTPTVPVADAVAASICLPVIFSPWEINGEFYVDGGIVSNLPAWPFDEERELDPEALTIAVEVEDQSQHPRSNNFAWLPAVIRTTLSGSAELNVRVSGPTEQLALPTQLDLLDFDVTADQASREVSEVAEAAGIRLDKRLFRLPEIYRNACQVAQAVAVDALGINPGGRGSLPRVRVAVGRLERGYQQSLRMSYNSGYEDDPDEFLLVPLTNSIAGAAWSDRQSILEVYPFDPARDLPGRGNRLRRKSRPRDLAWVMCIPILDEETSTPRLLVQLDGNFKLEENEETEVALNSTEEAVRDFFRLMLRELKELEGEDGVQQ